MSVDPKSMVGLAGTAVLAGVDVVPSSGNSYEFVLVIANSLISEGST